jgi:hypothetical protein
MPAEELCLSPVAQDEKWQCLKQSDFMAQSWMWWRAQRLKIVHVALERHIIYMQ